MSFKYPHDFDQKAYNVLNSEKTLIQFFLI